MLRFTEVLQQREFFPLFRRHATSHRWKNILILLPANIGTLSRSSNAMATAPLAMMR